MAGVGFELKNYLRPARLPAISGPILIRLSLRPARFSADQYGAGHTVLFHSLGIKGESAELFTASVIYSFVFRRFCRAALRWY